MNNTNESFRGSPSLHSFFSYDRLHSNDFSRGGHRPFHAGIAGTVHKAPTEGRALLGREGFLNDSKPTMYETRKLVNNDKLDQVALKNAIRAENYSNDDKALDHWMDVVGYPSSREELAAFKRSLQK